MSPLQAQILGNRFEALAREGAQSFPAMSRSPLVIDEGQYAASLLDGDGRLIAQDQGEPSHLVAVRDSVVRALDAFAFNVAEGDVILTGDPYHGGTWGGVLTVILPVFQGGDMRFVSAVRFAVPDMGGDVPGPYQPAAHEIWQEAMRLTPVKLFRAGAPQNDLRAYITRNSRAGEVVESDLTAAVATARRMAAGLDDMIESAGLRAVEEAVAARIAYTAALADAALASITAGEAREGPIAVTLKPGKPFLVELTASDLASDGPDNLLPSAVHAIVLMQLLFEVIEDVGMCEGLIDAVDIITEHGSRVDPSFPAAVSLGWRETGPILALSLAKASGRPSTIEPAASAIVLFPEIGSTAAMLPMSVSPGFSPASELAGADLASGRRRIPSAEEMETAGDLVMSHRRLTDSGMEVLLRTARDGFEAIALGGDRVVEIDGAEPHPRSSVLSLPRGTSIRFLYPERAGGLGAEQ